MSKDIPNAKSMFGGGQDDKNRKAGFGIGGAFGMPLPAMTQIDKWQRKNDGGDGPTFLNPKNWFNGEMEAELTGDRGKDMSHGLAKYGLFAAPWAPALLHESGKKGSEMRAQASADASAQKQADQFNAIQPSQNDVQFQGQNPYLSGPYNQTAGLLGGQSANAMPGQNPGIPQGQMGMPQGGQMGGLSPNTMNPQLQQWLMQNMNQANAGQMGGLL